MCSICGEEAGAGCGHQPGQVYDGKLCYLSLEEPADAYEFSFVAVPAQPQAGVVKANGREALRDTQGATGRLPPLCRRGGQAEGQAELGVRALKELREDVVRLAALADPQAEMKVLQSMVKHLEEPELRQLQRLLMAKKGGQELIPCSCPMHKSPSPCPGDGAF